METNDKGATLMMNEVKMHCFGNNIEMQRRYFLGSDFATKWQNSRRKDDGKCSKQILQM